MAHASATRQPVKRLIGELYPRKLLPVTLCATPSQVAKIRSQLLAHSQCLPDASQCGDPFRKDILTILGAFDFSDGSPVPAWLGTGTAWTELFTQDGFAANTRLRPTDQIIVELSIRFMSAWHLLAWRIEQLEASSASLSVPSGEVMHQLAAFFVDRIDEEDARPMRWLLRRAIVPTIIASLAQRRTLSEDEAYALAVAATGYPDKQTNDTADLDEFNACFLAAWNLIQTELARIESSSEETHRPNQTAQSRVKPHSSTPY